MTYPIKTLSQLPLVLKGFRKVKGLTQAALAEKLGITQQSYAYFEANPASATLERLYVVLRLLDVEISLDQTAPVAATALSRAAEPASQYAAMPKTKSRTSGKTADAAAASSKASGVTGLAPVAPAGGKKESW